MRRITLLLLPYLLVIVLLGAAEWCLREWVPALGNPLVTEVRYDGIEWYRVNPGYLGRYFSRGTPLVPEFKSSLFRKQKVAGAFRVMCLGESSMFGTPYMIAANLPSILRAELRHRFPGRDIEVINFGASAINSNVILDLSTELVRYDPDLVVVYMGHNEFYGPDGVGASLMKRLIPAIIPISYEVRDWRLVKLLFSLFPESRRGAGNDPNLMRQVSQGNSVALSSPDSRRIFSLFKDNLTEMVRFWKRHDVPLLVCDVSSNLLFPPFAYDTLDRGRYAAASADVIGGDLDGARRLLRGLRALDSTNAFVNYWQGRLDLASGDSAGAKIAFMRARDNDLLKFRAPSEIDTIIHRVCRAENVACLSVDSLFASLSPGGIPGDNLFWEHLHPTARGYYEIATMCFRKIVNDGIGQRGTEGAGNQRPLPFVADSLGICWLDLACADLAIEHLTSRWPFTGRRAVPVALGGADTTLRRIALETYLGQQPWDEGCYESASHFLQLGDLRDARTTYEAVLGEYPTNYYAHYLLGRLASKEGNTPDALTHLRQSVRSEPEFANSRLELGLNEINQARFDDALAQLDTAYQLARSAKPSLQAAILYGLAAATANKGEPARAVGYLDRALALVPGYQDALALRRQIERMTTR